MNSQSNAAAADYAWQAMPMKGMTPTSIVSANAGIVFATGWSYPNQKGSLQRWSPMQNSWTDLGGTFTDVPGPMSQGNGLIYIAGNTNNGLQQINKYSIINNVWTTLNTTFKGTVTAMTVDNSGNLYVTGNFINGNNHNYVAVFNPSTSSWSELPDAGFSGAALAIDMDKNGVLYVLTQDFSGNPSLYIYQNNAWSTPSISGAGQNLDTMCCDNNGNAYLMSDTAIYQFAVVTQTLTNLKAPIPAYSGTVSNTYLLHADGVLYAGITGYTGPTATSSAVLALQGGNWSTITPPKIASNNAAVIFGLAATDMNSLNLFVAANDGNAYDGKYLNH